MIVESMTYNDIIAEYNKDWYSELEDKVNRITTDNKYRRYIIKNLKDEKHVYFKPIFLTSKRGNKYVLHISTKGLSDFKKYGIMYLLYMYYRKSDGIHVAMSNRQLLNQTKADFMFYTPHLFDRYREREMKNIHIPKMDAIIECMKWNCTLYHKYVDCEKYPNSMFSVSPYGVILGTDLCDGNKLLKTYLPFSMLKGNQNYDKDDLRHSVLEYMDNWQ